jgi:DNA-3-methyladenine glycosylase
VDLCGAEGPLWLGKLEESRGAKKPAAIARTVRIGISQAADKLLRYYERGNPFVSGPKKLLSPAKNNSTAAPRKKRTAK